MIKTILLIAAAGALGAVVRYLVVLLATWRGLSYWGTFTVNVIGCFLVGVVMAHYSETEWFRSYGRSLLVIGFLGAFTTFSAFSMDTLQLVQSGKVGTALLYSTATVAGCLIATFGGFKLTNF